MKIEKIDWIKLNIAEDLILRTKIVLYKLKDSLEKLKTC